MILLKLVDKILRFYYLNHFSPSHKAQEHVKHEAYEAPEHVGHETREALEHIWQEAREARNSCGACNLSDSVKTYCIISILPNGSKVYKVEGTIKGTNK